MAQDLANVGSSLSKSLQDDNAVSIQYYDWLSEGSLQPLPNSDVFDKLQGPRLTSLIVKELFKPSQQVRRDVDAILEQVPAGTRLIGIHARGITGDLAIQPAEHRMFDYSANSHQAFVNCAIKFSQKFGDKVKYVVVSANEPTRQAIIKLLPPGSVLSLKRAPGQQGHSHHAGSDAERKTAAFAVAVDAFLLSRSDALVLTQSSSVSQFAALASKSSTVSALLPAYESNCGK